MPVVRLMVAVVAVVMTARDVGRLPLEVGDRAIVAGVMNVDIVVVCAL